MEAAAEASADVVGRAFWWSNCIQLRWMLWAMSHGGSLDNTDLGLDAASAVDDFDWVMQVRPNILNASLRVVEFWGSSGASIGGSLDNIELGA